jgi:hypothetical protein
VSPATGRRRSISAVSPCCSSADSRRPLRLSARHGTPLRRSRTPHRCGT